MAIDIPRNTVADHVVFDRIVDADRTIKIAREAAAVAAAAGKQDVADKLNEKADALEKILLATQHPDYEDEEEPPVGSSSDEDEGSGNSGNNPQNSGNNKEDGNQTDSEEEQGEQSGTGGGSNSDPQDSKSQDSGSGEEGKTPEDIANMDQHNGTHASGTQQIGPSGSGSGSNGSGSSGGSGGQGENSGAENSSNKQKGGQKELDPFRLQLGQGNGQQEQPTKEEILAAVIKRLNSLGGNAKAGADRALRKLFDELGGSGDIDD